MPRDSNGIYTLPAGNPVVSGTVIESVWANNTMTDISQALTGSMPRDGSAPMTGTLQIASGNLELTGVGQRIRGDFSNAAISSRTLFQTTTLNANTSIGAIPNGTATYSNFSTYSGSDPTNASYFSIGCNATGGLSSVNSSHSGTGSDLPISFQIGNTEKMQLTTNGILVLHNAGAEGGELDLYNVANTAVQGFVDIDALNNVRVFNVGTGGQNVTIGTSNTGGGGVILRTQGNDRFFISAAGNMGLGIAPSDSVPGQSRFFAIGDSDTGIGWPSDGILKLYANNTAMLQVNSSNFMSPGNGFATNADSWQLPWTANSRAFAAAGSGNQITFYQNGTAVGSISTNATNTAFNTASDRKLKEVIQPFENAIWRVMMLKPCKWKWKLDGSDGEGFIADELKEVLPSAVSEVNLLKENGDVDTDAEPLGMVDYSRLTPLLAAGLQAALVKIEELEAKVAHLEDVAGGLALP